MNKRVQELVVATDAWCDQNLPSNWTDKVDEYLPVWNAKFAELIVKECLEQIDKMRDGLEADNEDQHALGADWAGLAVARHFGVE